MPDVEWDGFPENRTQEGWHWVNDMPWHWVGIGPNKNYFVWYPGNTSDIFWPSDLKRMGLQYLRYGGPCLKREVNTCKMYMSGGHLDAVDWSCNKCGQGPTTWGRDTPDCWQNDGFWHSDVKKKIGE